MKYLVFVFVLLIPLACSNGGGNRAIDGKDTQKPITNAIDGKFVPDDGKLIMFIGQDSETISDYVAAMPSDNIEGVTLYTRLISNKIGNGEAYSLAGIFGEADWGAGKVNYKKTLDESPGAALAVGLFLSDTPVCKSTHTKELVDGKYEDALNTMVDYFKGLAPRKVFLRIGFEYDGPWNCYRPDAFKAAFRYIHQRIQDRNAHNVATVWHSAVWPAPEIAGEFTSYYDHKRDDLLDLWYPGDDVVDWMGISVFYRDLSRWNYTPSDRPQDAQAKFLSFARKHNKPILVAEAAPQGFRIGALTQSYTQKNLPEPVSADQIWNGWFASFFDFVYENRDVIRGVAYINTQWESQQMWYCEEGESPKVCGQGNWGDSRVHVNDLVKSKWLENVNDSDLWSQSSP